MSNINDNVEPRAMLAELFGTFVLAAVALMIGDPVIVGFTLVGLVLGTAAISGAHLNPAVSFGLWSIKKISAARMLAYWVMQFLGAALAMVLIKGLKGDIGMNINFFTTDWYIILAEIIGMAVFSFAIAAAVNRKLADAAGAICIGFGLMIGLYVGGGVLASAATNKKVMNDKESRIAKGKVAGAVLNPAIALVADEKEDRQAQQMQQLGGEAPKKEKVNSRFSVETVLGALLGGAIGMQLYTLMAGVNPFVREEAKESATAIRNVASTSAPAKTKTTKTKVVKKSAKKGRK